MYRVAITGIGIVSSLGNDIETVADSLRHGNEETGLIFGSDSSCLAAVEQVDLLRKFKETKMIGSGLVFQSMTSTITMNLNTILKTRGASWTISSACSSGAHAVGQAADLIALGRQERVICGAAQEINWQSICSFDAPGAFSTRVDMPHAASRPFDASRDGLVPGGGAVLCLGEFNDQKRKIYFLQASPLLQLRKLNQLCLIFR